MDLATRKLVRVLKSGQDPETFDISPDGKTLYVSNEETAEMSVLDLASGEIRNKVTVGREPEGVTVSPDGKTVYVTSEEDGEVTAVDTGDARGPRPHAHGEAPAGARLREGWSHRVRDQRDRRDGHRAGYVGAEGRGFHQDLPELPHAVAARARWEPCSRPTARRSTSRAAGAGRWP